MILGAAADPALAAAAEAFVWIGALLVLALAADWAGRRVVRTCRQPAPP